RFSYLIGRHLDVGVVAALRQRAHRELADGAAVREPPRRFFGRHQARAEERLRRLEHLVRTRTRPMEVFHVRAHADLKRRNVRLLNTTERLDHAIPALPSTGHNRTPATG